MNATCPVLLWGLLVRLYESRLLMIFSAPRFASCRAPEPGATRPSGAKRIRIVPGRGFQILILVVCIGVSLAVGDNREGNALVDRSLKASGVQSQLEMLPEAFLSWLPGGTFPGAKPKKEALEFVRKASEEAALESVRSALVKDLDAEKMEKVLAFYESKLGRKVARLQGSALSPSLISAIREGRKATVSQDDQRLQVIRRLVRAEGIPDAASKLAKSAMSGILDGARSSRKGPEEEIKIESVLPQQRHQSGESGTEESALIAFSNTFSSLDDKELEEFATFSESPAAVWFRETLRKGLDEAVYTTGKAVGRALSSEPVKTP